MWCSVLWCKNSQHCPGFDIRGDAAVVRFWSRADMVLLDWNPTPSTHVITFGRQSAAPRQRNAGPKLESLAYRALPLT
ncbi:hypothetical protein F5Y07DRAFT_64124 [Xylaria sp. FL0933]|nr:hypothetical protein F5Y07DRAFT_64124 [Xylaria sp. FL0933]